MRQVCGGQWCGSGFHYRDECVGSPWRPKYPLDDVKKTDKVAQAIEDEAAQLELPYEL